MEHRLHNWLRMRIETAGLVLLLAAFVGCKGSTETPAAEKTKSSIAPTEAAQTNDEQMQQGRSGRHRDDPNSGWVPGEYRTGMARFRDPGVYVDGVLVGMLKFGELPVPMKVTWWEEEASVSFTAEYKGPKTTIVKQRRYRFTDYFRAIGLDVEQIKEVHIYGGGKRRASSIVSGEDLRKHNDLMFRFGGDVWGKPIPSCPSGVTDGRCPDNLTAITVYIKRKPPVREGRYFVLDGKVVEGIPYYGEPIRGGVRVYLDGLLVTTIKRHKLTDESLAVTSKDGKTRRWKLFEFLKANGVNPDPVQEAWLIHQDRRVKRIGREKLTIATFRAEQQRSGEILFGVDDAPTNALALHTKHVSEKDLPVILPDEG